MIVKRIKNVKNAQERALLLANEIIYSYRKRFAKTAEVEADRLRVNVLFAMD